MPKEQSLQGRAAPHGTDEPAAKRPARGKISGASDGQDEMDEDGVDDGA